MKISLDVLDELKFVKTHNVSMEGDVPIFTACCEIVGKDDQPSVYMWLSPIKGTADFDVLYVGKAGYGVARRLKQHQGGFVNSSAGRDNRRLITEWLKTERMIGVYRRVSEVQSVLGQKIYLYSSEEQALCERFSPLWNRARFPQVSRKPEGLIVMPSDRSFESPEQDVDEAPVTQGQRSLSVDFSNLALGDEVVAFLNSLEMEKHDQFLQLGDLLQQRQPAAQQKITQFYTGQPSGYHNTPMYVFGFIGNDGKARRRTGWIPLVDSSDAPLTVIFPKKERRPNVDSSIISEGAKGDWRPLDLSHFLSNVSEYLVSVDEAG